MGTVDIEEEIDRFIVDDRIIHADIPFETLYNLLNEVITEVTERHYSIGENEGEIDDWDMWEMDVITECNKRIEKILG